METLKKVVSNQYFPSAAVLTAVLLFWVVGMLGGLSLLNNNQPPLTTLTWMLFVYAAAVLTPLAGLLAAVDLLRRWRRNRAAAPAAGAAPAAAVEPVSAAEPAIAAEPTVPASAEPATTAAAGAPAPEQLKPDQSTPAQRTPDQSMPEQPKAAQQSKPRHPGRKAA